MESLFAAPKTELPQAIVKRKSYLRRVNSIHHYKLGGHTPLGLFINDMYHRGKYLSLFPYNYFKPFGEGLWLGQRASDNFS